MIAVNHLLTLPAIVAATSGGIGTLGKVLKDYVGYACQQSLYDEYVSVHLFLNEELRRKLKTQLAAGLQPGC